MTDMINIALPKGRLGDKVYDMFVEQFPMFATIVPFNIFSKWVDLALEWMREQLEKNSNIKAFIEGTA